MTDTSMNEPSMNEPSMNEPSMNEPSMNEPSLTDTSVKTVTSGRATIRLEVIELGDDLLLVLTGGDSPHVGTVVMTEPRGDREGEMYRCTTSVLNVTGHRDEEVARPMAEAACKSTGKRVVCVSGIHLDNASRSDINDALDACRELAKKVF